MNISADRYNSPWQGSRGQEYHKGYAKKGQEDMSVPEEKKGTEGASENQADKTCREQILEKMAEMAKKVKDGTVEPTFQIGAMCYTMKEWDKLLEKFDAAEEALQEALQDQIEEVEKQAAKEALRREAESKAGTGDTVTAVAVTKTAVPAASESVAGRAQHEGAGQSSASAAQSVSGAQSGSQAQGAVGGAESESQAQGTASGVQSGSQAQGTASRVQSGSQAQGAAGAVQSGSRTEEMDAEQTAALLTDEITKCSYPTDDPKQKHWFITAYSKDGISCKEAYFDGTKWVNKDCFNLPFTEEGQYEKVMAFLKRFPEDANLRFAAHENFWKDFLAGEIDEDDFVAFFETTKDGVPDYTYTEGDSTYIDREKAKYAKYMNDFGAQFYTAEEMELIQRAVLNENKKSLQPLSDYDGAMTIPGGSGKQADAGEEELKTQIVTKPDGTAVLKITTADGEMEIAVSQARKWGLQ